MKNKRENNSKRRNNNHPSILVVRIYLSIVKHQWRNEEARFPRHTILVLKLLTANPQFRYHPNSRKFIQAVTTFTNLEFQFIGVSISSHEWRVHLWYTSDNTTRNLASG